LEAAFLIIPDRPGGAIWELAPVGELHMVSFLTTTRVSRFIPAMTRRARRMAALEAFMPTFPVTAMVFIIKILVITLTNVMAAPIGILVFKILPVMRMALIPRIPFWRIPDIGSDNIGGRISVIGGPAILLAEKLIQ
jgi:hypothetical protein